MCVTFLHHSSRHIVRHVIVLFRIRCIKNVYFLWRKDFKSYKGVQGKPNARFISEAVWSRCQWTASIYADLIFFSFSLTAIRSLSRATKFPAFDVILFPPPTAYSNSDILLKCESASSLKTFAERRTKKFPSTHERRRRVDKNTRS